MPCRSDWDEGPSAYQRQIDLITRVACELAKHVPSTYKLSKETQTWIEAHRLADQRREQREREERQTARVKAEAMAKLTPAERKALRLSEI